MEKINLSMTMLIISIIGLISILTIIIIYENNAEIKTTYKPCVDENNMEFINEICEYKEKAGVQEFKDKLFPTAAIFLIMFSMSLLSTITIGFYYDFWR